MAIFMRLIVRIIPAALALVVVSGGSIIAGYSVGFSELKFLQEWMGLATVGLGCGGGVTLVGMSALLLQKIRCAADCRGAPEQHARALKQKREATGRRLAAAVRNIEALSGDERSLLMDALKRYPFCIEVPEFGPSQLLISKEFLCVLGEVGDTSLICRIHPWLAAHRGELIGIHGAGP